MMAPPDEQARLDHLYLAVPGPIKQKLEGRLNLHEGDRITQPALNDLSATLNDLDEHLRLSLEPNQEKTGSIITISLDTGSGESPKRIRVGGNAQAANLIQKVIPPYPAESKANRVQGTVRFTVIIGKDGTVKSVALVSGDPVLAQAAKDAVQKWVYRPTLLNGDPVEVMTQVDVNFTLSQ